MCMECIFHFNCRFSPSVFLCCVIIKTLTLEVVLTWTIIGISCKGFNFNTRLILKIKKKEPRKKTRIIINWEGTGKHETLHGSSHDKSDVIFFCFTCFLLSLICITKTYRSWQEHAAWVGRTPWNTTYYTLNAQWHQDRDEQLIIPALTVLCL